MLGLQLQINQGYAAAEAEQAYARARDLCMQMPKTPRLFSVLWGLWLFYAVRAANRSALEIAEQLFRLSGQIGDPAALLLAHSARGITRLFLGELSASRVDLERSVSLYTPDRDIPLAWQYGQDPKVACLAQGSSGLWLLGESERSLEANREALALARRLSHPHSLAQALYFAAILHQRRREPGPSRERAEDLIRLANEHGFGFWSAGGAILRGRALAEQGSLAEGLAEIQRGVAAWRSTGAVVNLTYLLALLAETLGAALGRLPRGWPSLPKPGVWPVRQENVFTRQSSAA